MFNPSEYVSIKSILHLVNIQTIPTRLKKPEQAQAIEDLTEEDEEDIFLDETENVVDENLANVEKLNNVDVGLFVFVAKCFGKQLLC